jgi:trk system potassium uptake protein
MRHVVIGCGRVGARLAALLTVGGHEVAVIDQQPEALARLPSDFPGHALLGDGLDRRLLLTAGIERCSGLAAVTGSDETNAVIARLARTRFSVPRVVARIYDPAKADIYRRLGVQTIAPAVWSVERLIELLTLSELAPVASIGTGDVEILDAVIPAALQGREVGQLSRSGEAQVIAVTRQGHTFLVGSPATPLHAGDIVHLAVTTASAAAVETLLRSS